MATEAIAETEKPLTLADLRIAARGPENGGILLGGWSVDSGKPLLAPLQEMADDIAKWFKPEQKWRLTEVKTSYINDQRIKQSLATQRHPFDGVKVVKALGKQPDQFTPTFLFEADNPPMTTIARRGSQRLKGVNLGKVFRHEFRRFNVTFYPEIKNADVSPEKIGSIYPLEQASKELSSPYYLYSVTVSPSQREADQEMWTADKKSGQKKDSEPLRSLTVMVLARDLGDYLHLQVTKARRLDEKFKKKFPLK